MYVGSVWTHSYRNNYVLTRPIWVIINQTYIVGHIRRTIYYFERRLFLDQKYVLTT